MKNDARSIIGKTVTGVISRPATDGAPAIVMLQFSDGTCFEFVSPSSRRALAHALTPGLRRGAQSLNRLGDDSVLPQMSMFPLDGDNAAAAA